MTTSAGRAVLLLSILLSACALLPQRPLPDDLAAWAEGGRRMVWNHTTLEPLPPMPLERFEVCGDFGLAFFDSSEHRLFIADGAGGFIDDDLLWAGGPLSEPPENLEGGFVASPQDPRLNMYHDDLGPCEVIFEA